MAHLDIGWEVGDLGELPATLNSFFLPQSMGSHLSHAAPSSLALPCWCVHGWCECLRFGKVGS